MSGIGGATCPDMRIRAISTGRLILLLTIILASSNNAKAISYPLTLIGSTNLTIGDQHELGQVRPATPEGDSAIGQYVNFMIGLSLGGSGHVIIGPHDVLVTRSTNNFWTLPSPTTLPLRGTSQTVALGFQGTYAYLFAHFGGPGGGFAEVWNVATLNGNVTIPAEAFEHGFSGWALFTMPAGIPDRGTTAIMLGVALGILSVVRRCLAI
jgi:hypothetical protein